MRTLAGLLQALEQGLSVVDVGKTSTEWEKSDEPSRASRSDLACDAEKEGTAPPGHGVQICMGHSDRRFNERQLQK